MNPFSFFKNFRARPVTRLGISLIVLAATALHAQAATQTLKLKKGWNLVTVQVQPDDPSPTAVFGGTVGAAVKSVWEFDNRAADAGGKKWKTFRFPNTGENRIQNQLEGVTLGQVDFGDSFWIEVDRDRDLPINGEVPMVAPPVALTKGWNLIGIPTALPTGVEIGPKQFTVLEVLSNLEIDYKSLLKWQADAPSANGNPDTGADDAKKEGYNKLEGGITGGDDFRFFDPNRAYWIFITEDNPKPIRPILSATARGDLNVEPIGFPGVEDIHISGKDEPVDGAEIGIVKFISGEDTQKVSLANVGGGLLGWEVEWVPGNEGITDTGGKTNLIAAPAQAVSLSYGDSLNGNYGLNSVLVSGVASSTVEKIYLRLNRKGLAVTAPDTAYVGKLRLRTSASSEVKEYTVLIEVPGLAGDWTGEAKIKTVSGKQNRIPDVDLNLTFFEDPAQPGLLRGVINSSRSVVWPVDVPLVGYLSGENKDRLTLGGSYLLPAGDRNFEPFDEFDPAANDVDWDNDQILDRANPFPFPIFRSVQLEGRLVKAAHTEGYEIVGNYQEAVHGMTPEPIQLKGEFSISRTQKIPFTSGTDSGSSTPSPQASVVTVRTGSTSNINNGQTRTLGQDVGFPLPAFERNFALQDIRVGFKLNPSDNPDGVPAKLTEMTTKLIGPNGAFEIILHDRQIIDERLLEEVSYPAKNVATGLGASGVYPDWASFVAAASQKTEGQWKIEVTNRTGNRLLLSDVFITLVGQPVHDVTVQVDGANGILENASVSLNGLPFSMAYDPFADHSASPDFVQNGNGSVTFRALPFIPLNFAASSAGYPSGSSVIASQLLPKYDNLTPVERELLDSFTGLPVTPFAGMSVSGYDSNGSETSPLKIDLGAPLEAGIGFKLDSRFSVAPAEITVEAYGSLPQVPQWKIFQVDNDDVLPVNWTARGDVPVASFSGPRQVITIANPGYYEAILTVGPKTERQFFTVWSSPGNTATPSESGLTSVSTFGAGNPHPPDTLNKDYPVQIFVSRFAGGGSMTRGSALATPMRLSASAASPRADLFMLQHTYAASFDLDLAPKTSGFGASLDSDNFTRFNGTPANYWNFSNPLNALSSAPEITPEINFPNSSAWRNDAGWRHEDHNYWVEDKKWFWDVNPTNPPVFMTGDSDFAAQNKVNLIESKYDEPVPFPNDFDPEHSVIKRYKMAVCMGSPISAASAAPLSIRQANDQIRYLTDDLEPGDLPGATSPDFILITNPFIFTTTTSQN